MYSSDFRLDAISASGSQTTFCLSQISFLRNLGYWALFCLLALPPIAACSQSYDSLDVALHDFEVISSLGTLQSGDSTTLFIHAGTIANPVENARGMDIELEFSPDVDLNSIPVVTAGPDWEGLSVSLDLTARTLRVQAFPADNPGHAQSRELFQITLFSNGNGVSTASLIENAGGLLIIDNIGLKHYLFGEIQLESATRIYPNPCRDRLYMDWDQAPKTLHLLDQQGRLLPLPASAIQMGSCSVQGLPDGLYSLVLEYEKGNEVKRFLVRSAQ